MNSALTASEFHSLNVRLAELERERSDAREQSRVLLLLQTRFTAIARTRSPDEVIALMLRAAYNPLRFSRALYFAVDREKGIVARFQLDGSEVVDACSEQIELRPSSSFVAVMRGDSEAGIGTAQELSAPLVDVRNWYAISALQHAEGSIGMLYVDDHPSPLPLMWEAGLVRALATIAAVSMENGLLFARTRELAARDPLTGLFNRRAFSERLLEAIEWARRNERSLTYVLIDVDDFKAVNDTYGHAYGDALLKRLGATLARSSRTNDIVGRYAGDEFVAIISDVDRDTATILVARLSQDIRDAGLHCSLGAALYPQNAIDAGTLLAAADRALYAAKAAGKNGYAFA